MSLEWDNTSGGATGALGRDGRLSSPCSAVRTSLWQSKAVPRIAVLGVVAWAIVGWVGEGTGHAYTERSKGGPLQKMGIGRGNVIRVVGQIAGRHLTGEKTVHVATDARDWVGRSNEYQMLAVHRLQPPSEIPQNRPKKQQAERWFFFKHKKGKTGFETELTSVLVYSGKRNKPAPTKYEGRDLVAYILGEERKTREDVGQSQPGWVEHDRVTVQSQAPTPSEAGAPPVLLSTEVVAWIEGGNRIVFKAKSTD